ncbi:MAG: glucokinase [Gammaproteobacteria bacterium]|nr:MAG: glucokinase [Gammaproteobacteria bacterium]
MTADHYPRLVADIGGTNARFAIETEPFQLEHLLVLPCQDYGTFAAAMADYLAQTAMVIPRHVGIAIANPVTADNIRMTNHHWHFSIRAMQKQLGVDTFLLVNDFRAQALAITRMSAANLALLNGPAEYHPVPKDRTVAVIGPGTGLGVSGLVPDGRGRMIALSGEGGHVSYSPYDQLERQLLSFAKQIYGGHVSAERLLQGDGLLLIYRFMAGRNKTPPRKNTPAEVTHGALVEYDPLCIKVLSRYCAILGGFCADVVLTIGGVGGVYLGGGIIPRFIDFLKQSDFRRRFEDKGRLADYLRNVPVYVITHPNPGLLGAAVALDNKLAIK